MIFKILYVIFIYTKTYRKKNSLKSNLTESNSHITKNLIIPPFNESCSVHVSMYVEAQKSKSTKTSILQIYLNPTPFQIIEHCMLLAPLH